jgi:hypothetical protein
LFSYVEVFALTLAYLCSIPPSLEPSTYYHLGVEIFIDDEAREGKVDAWGFFHKPISKST